MRTLFLNPPSFENFDGGASSRWPATREIESYWYPVWLCYPAGMLRRHGARRAAASRSPPKKPSRCAKDYELLVLFTSTPGFTWTSRSAEMIKEANPKLELRSWVRRSPSSPRTRLRGTSADRFRCRREFDYRSWSMPRASHSKRSSASATARTARLCTTPKAGRMEDLDAMPWVTKVYKRDLDVTPLQRAVPAAPVHSALLHARLPGAVHLLPVAADASRTRWRMRSADDVAAEMTWARENFPDVKEFFFDDDTFNFQKARTIELCEKLKPLGLTW